MARNNLPEVSFAERDAATIESNIITIYESVSGRQLSPGDPVRLFLEAVAAIIVNQRSIIDYAGKQNLLSYAEGPFLDALGALVLGPDGGRLPAQPALATVRFTLSAAQSGTYTVPIGTELSGGNLIFKTRDLLEIDEGDLTGDVVVEADTPGASGNGVVVGQIKTLVVPLPFVASVSNITATSGGADIENDENFYQRIRLAPDSFSVAGPEGAYIFWSRTANQSIIDVSVYSLEEEPGRVYVRPLLSGGTLPGSEVIGQVEDVLSADDIRPLTDEVIVAAPVAANYTINIDYWISSESVTEVSNIQSKVLAAVEEYRVWQRTKIGRDINPDELIQRVKNAGAKRIVVTTPVFTVLDATQVAQETSVTVDYQGIENA
jgi:phage-related baseplate assembly protein